LLEFAKKLHEEVEMSDKEFRKLMGKLFGKVTSQDINQIVGKVVENRPKKLLRIQKIIAQMEK